MRKSSLVLLLLAVVGAGCLSGSASADVERVGTEPLERLSLSASDMSGQIRVEYQNQSKTGIETKFVSETDDLTVYNNVYRFNSSKKALKYVNNSLNRVNYSFKTLGGSKSYKYVAISGTLTGPERGAEFFFFIQNGNTTSTVSIYGQKVEDATAISLIETVANKMAVSYDSDRLKKALNEFDPHGPENPMKVGSLSYVVTKASTFGALGSGRMVSQPDGTYLVLSLEIENTGESPTVFSSGNFRILTGEGGKYEVDTEGLTYLGTMVQMGSLRPLSFEEIQPGETVSGSIVFDVPEDAYAALEICEGGFSNNCKRLGIGKINQIK